MSQAELGTDIVVGKNLKTITGFDNLARQLIYRLSIPRGSLFWDPDCGDDIRLFLNSKISPSLLDQIKSVVKTQCEQDPRVDNADVEIIYNKTNLSLEITIYVTTFEGPFTLVLSVNSLSIETLTISS